VAFFGTDADSIHSMDAGAPRYICADSKIVARAIAEFNRGVVGWASEGARAGVTDNTMLS
jgi:hypothetical protein